MKQFVLSLLIALSFHTFSQTTIMLDSTELEVDTVITGLDIPWEMQWHDGYIWITERYGMVSRINAETGVKDTVLDLSSQVYQQNESGLLGLVLHPQFSTNPQVYLVYTYLNGPIKERMVRYDYNGTSLINPLVIIEEIPGNTTHDGSRLLVLPDNTLLMTTGDAQNQSLPLDTSSVVGKTLRFNLDGSIPADNPNPGSPVWSWGHRNAQGLTLGPNNKIYSSEHGPTTDDEMNILEKGGNYGWPEVHGFCDAPNEMTYCANNMVTEPVYAWTPTIATSDIIWYDNPVIPEFENTLLMTVLKNKELLKMNFDASGNSVTSVTAYFKNEWGRLRDILVGPEGEIYLATNGSSWSNTQPNTHSIIRLRSTRDINNSIKENSSTAMSLDLFPNPVKDQVQVQVRVQDQRQAAELKPILNIHNSAGMLVYSDTIGVTETIVNVSVNDLSGGIYFVSIESQGDIIVTKKMVKE